MNDNNGKIFTLRMAVLIKLSMSQKETSMKILRQEQFISGETASKWRIITGKVKAGTQL
jgi:hypothetical protein